MTLETVFTYGSPALKFGAGAADEIGYDLAQLGVTRVLVVTDAGVAATGNPQRVAEAMANFGIEARVYDGVHVEPTDVSLNAAIDHARQTGPFDAYVAVGGGSSIDTAKAINLLTTNPGELMDYINAPVGKAGADRVGAGAVRARRIQPGRHIAQRRGGIEIDDNVVAHDCLYFRFLDRVADSRHFAGFIRRKFCRAFDYNIRAVGFCGI